VARRQLGPGGGGAAMDTMDTIDPKAAMDTKAAVDTKAASTGKMDRKSQLKPT